MKDLLQKHRDRLSPHEERMVWEAIRPANIERRRALAMRRWAFSFAAAAAAVVVLAFLLPRRETQETGSRQVTVVLPGRTPRPEPADAPRATRDVRETPFAQTAGPGAFVDAGEESLAVVPLAYPASRFHRARGLLADGVLPPRDLVRIEDFVNAMGGGLPDTGSTALAVHVDGCPSPFDDRIRMLRIAIRARRSTRSVAAHVTFDPRTVASYRLLASRPEPADSARSGAGDGYDLGAGEQEGAGRDLARGVEAVALYEIRLREEPAGNRVAGVALSYEDSTGTAVRRDATFAMSQWAPRYGEAAPSLRLCVAAAGFAELLRAEPSPAPRPTFAELARLAWQIAADSRGDPKAVDFALLIERTDDIERALTPEQRWQWESGGLPALPDDSGERP